MGKSDESGEKNWGKVRISGEKWFYVVKSGYKYMKTL